MNIKKITQGNVFWALMILAGILAFNAAATPNFFRLEIREGHLFGSLVDVFDRAAPVILMATGMTLVIALKGIDISVSSVAAISGSIAAVLVTNPRVPVALVILLPLAAAVLLGVWNGFLVAGVGIQPIIATMILMTTGRGIAQLICDGQIVIFRNPVLEYVGGGFLFGLPFSITLAAGVAVAVSLFTRGTALGLFIESIGINPRASRSTGIKVSLITFSVFIVSAFCAGVAGLYYVSDIRAADSNNAALYTEMDAILAVVIGGTSMSGGRYSILGSVIGAVLVQSLTTTILTRGVPVQVTLILRATVILVICIVQSPDFVSKLASVFRKGGSK